VGVEIKKILSSRLPERLAGKLPAAFVEIAVGLLVAALAVAVRYMITPLIGDIAPYAFVFVAAALAAVIAGWRSGLVAIVVGQALVWYAILAPLRAVTVTNPNPLAGLVVATISQLILLLVIALYQREIDKSAANREKQLTLLDEALKEIDHRTRNNYGTVLAMIDLQARRASSEKAREALRQVADRIQAVANASQQLAARSADLGAVRLDDHLCSLVEQIERGLSREEIQVDCDVEQVTASADKATSISIIVNELVTNALKHAFNGESSGHVWVTGKTGSAFELIVADDGRGIQASRPVGDCGLGTRLVESFARQLGAKHEVVSNDKGTRHRLVIPRLD
jgi:two-component sensor histidine kinase